MSSLHGTHRDRVLDLLADNATTGLDQAELAALERELASWPSLDAELNDGSMDRAAAAADLAFSRGMSEKMPEALRAKLQSEGERIVREKRPVEVRTLRFTRESSGPDTMRWAGWVAAAACLVLAAGAWFGRPVGGPGGNLGGNLGGGSGGGSGGVADSSGRTRSLLEARNAMLASAPDVTTIPLGAWDNPEQPSVTGDVVWSEAAQTGYLRLVGLKPNDPGVEQYQLWIVDSRGMNQRISGALFDANPDPTTGEVIVKIDPRIETQDAVAFALTIEKPGGVWVSDMTRRVVIGAKG